MADPFATAAEVCEFIGVDVPSDLTRLQSYLQMVSSKMRSYCRQTLSFVADDEVTRYPSASSFLSLPQRPVTEVSEVLVDGVATTDYYVVPRGIRSGSVASPGSAWTRGAMVTYSHGFAETDPEFPVLRSICIEATARAYAPNASGSPEVLASIALESGGYAPAVFLTGSEKETLSSFMRGLVR
jgi:hypothetical protein